MADRARRTDGVADADVRAADQVGGPSRRLIDSDGRAKVYRPLDPAHRRSAREAGIATYEEGGFFEAHELMEPAWMGSADQAERDLDQGLIKLAAAYVHAQRGNPIGMRKNLAGARRRLAAVVGAPEGAGDRAQQAAGVDAGLLLERVESALEAVERLGPGAQEDEPLVQRIPPPVIPRLGSGHDG
jgi:predicted metal-dependent hydrolase